MMERETRDGGLRAQSQALGNISLCWMISEQHTYGHVRDLRGEEYLAYA